MNPIKIVHIIGAMDTGGVQRNLLALLPLLNKKGFCCSVIVLRERGNLADELEKKGVPVTLCFQRTRWSLGSLLKLKKALIGADIVHAHMRRANTSAALSHILGASGKVVFMEEDLALGKKIRHHIIDRFLSSFSKADVVCVSKEVKKANQQWIGFSEHRTRVIYNGVDIEHFKNTHDKNTCRKKLGLPVDCKVVGTMGRLHSIKKTDVFIRACKLLLKYDSSIQIAIAGDGEEKDALKSLANNLGISDNVHFLGMLSSPELFYRACDAFVLTSKSEGHPMVVLEAFASGVPLACTLVGGVAETANDQISTIIKVGDEVSTCEGIKTALSPVGQEKALGASRHIETFSIEVWAENTSDLYLEILDRNGVV